MLFHDNSLRLGTFVELLTVVAPLMYVLKVVLELRVEPDDRSFIYIV